jgi:mannose-6-phosphate isomerase
VHALGAGLLIAEIQQASDTTWRLYDWDRVGPDGQPRKLHIDEALNAIDYSAGMVMPQSPKATDKPHVKRLVACDKFVLDRWELIEAESIGGGDRFHILSVIEGEALLGGSADEAIAAKQPGSTTSDEVTLLSLIRGQTVLLPASITAATIAPRKRCVLLDIYLP